MDSAEGAEAPKAPPLNPPLSINKLVLELLEHLPYLHFS